MYKIPMVIFGLLAPFFFPWQITLVFMLILGLFVPVLPFLMGVLEEFAYFSSPGIPYFFIIGILLAIICYFVHQFIKTRIIF